MITHCFPQEVSIKGSISREDCPSVLGEAAAGPSPGPAPWRQNQPVLTCDVVLEIRSHVAARRCLQGGPWTLGRAEGEDCWAVPRPLSRAVATVPGSHSSQEQTPCGSAW